MMDALLDLGADLNAKSRWWAGGFGVTHVAEPELAAYAVERGAVVDIHAASRLGHFDRRAQTDRADPSLVHARGGDGQTPLHFAKTSRSRPICSTMAPRSTPRTSITNRRRRSTCSAIVRRWPATWLTGGAGRIS